MAIKRSVLVVVALMSCVLMQSADSSVHIVGGSCGWEIPPHPNFYADWAKSITFCVGDELVFPFRDGGHNVIQVTKEDFETCGHDHVMAQYHKGQTTIQLDIPGDYYFYSNVGTHCEMGQKLHITTTGSSRHLLGLPGTAETESEAPAPAPAPGPPYELSGVPAASNNVAQFFGLVVACSVAVLLI